MIGHRTIQTPGDADRARRSRNHEPAVPVLSASSPTRTGCHCTLLSGQGSRAAQSPRCVRPLPHFESTYRGPRNAFDVRGVILTGIADRPTWL